MYWAPQWMRKLYSIGSWRIRLKKTVCERERGSYICVSCILVGVLALGFGGLSTYVLFPLFFPFFLLFFLFLIALPLAPSVDLAPKDTPNGGFRPPSPPPQPPIEPFKLTEGSIPPEAPPPPEPLHFEGGGIPIAPAEGLPTGTTTTTTGFSEKIAQTASVRGTSNYHPKGLTGLVGLQNQGATCYLNSLLQTLYLDPIFRRTVYEWRYDERKDGPSSKNIPFQLQLLFAELQIGDNGIAKTGNLTESFGWINGEQYQQHDVQELMRVLLNAVEESFKEKVTDVDSRVTPVYTGSFEDYTQCESCGHRRARVDPFMDVQLFIERANSLQEALVTFITPEVLDGDNKVECSGCKSKVNAKKGLVFRTLPQVLTLQLKRFTYDPRTWQRVKLGKRVVYPLYIDLGPYVNTTTVEGVSPSPAPAAAGDVASSSMNPADSVLEQIRARKEKAEGGGGGGASVVDSSSGEKKVAERPSEECLEPVDDNGILRPTMDQLNAAGSQWYELFSILIHSGGAMGGHYYAYCKDVHTGKWFNFNDMDVRSIDEAEAKRMCGQDGPSVSSTNAYMLLYRRMRSDDDAKTVYVGPELIPDYIRNLIATENDEIKEKKREYDEAMRFVTVNVFHILGSKEDAGVSMTLERALTVSEAASEIARRLALPLEGFDVRLRNYLPKRGKITGDSFQGRENDTLQALSFHNNKNVFLERKARDDDWRVDVPSMAVEIVMANQGKSRFEAPRFVSVRSTCTVRQLMNAVYEMWKGRGIFVDRNDVALVRIHGESFEHTSRFGNWRKPLSELGIVDGARVYAETRMRGEDSGLLEKVNWDDMSPAVSDEHVDPNLVYGAPVSGGSDPSDEEMSEWNSFTVMQFEVQRNTIELYYNIPTKPQKEDPQMDQMIEIDQRLPLKELRLKLASILQLESKEFIIRKNLDKKEYRDDDARLADLKLYTGNALLLEIGTPLAMEQFKLRFYIFDPCVDGDAAFKSLGEFTVRKDQSLLSLKTALQEWQGHKEGYARLSEKIGSRCSRVLLGDARLMWDVCPHMRDGFELVIQWIPVPDNLGVDDMIVLIKRWNKDGSGELQAGQDEIVVHKNDTLFQVRATIAQHCGIAADDIAISKPWRSLLSQLSTVVEAIQSVNWDVDLQCIASKSPWYLAAGELIMYKDKKDPEKLAQFLESMHSAPSSHAHNSSRAEPALRIMTKFDHDHSREHSSPQSPAFEEPPKEIIEKKN